MAHPLADFLSKLSQDPQTVADFKNDPDSVMDEHGLSDHDKEVVNSGDADKVREHLGDDSPPGCFAVF